MALEDLTTRSIWNTILHCKFFGLIEFMTQLMWEVGIKRAFHLITIACTDEIQLNIACVIDQSTAQSGIGCRYNPQANFGINNHCLESSGRPIEGFLFVVEQAFTTFINTKRNLYHETFDCRRIFESTLMRCMHVDDRPRIHLRPIAQVSDAIRVVPEVFAY